MKYFDYLNKDDQQALFYLLPHSFNKLSKKETLAYSLGATLYMPATRPYIAEDILRKKWVGLISLILDLEDAVGDNQIEDAESSLIIHLQQLSFYIETGTLNLDDLPLVFIRVRDPHQMERIVNLAEHTLQVITGFVFPKFSVARGWIYFEKLEQINRLFPFPIYGMPILETSDILYKETRGQTLAGIKNILDSYQDRVLNVRIGATDLSSLLGLRRNPKHTIYEIAPICDCLIDIINLFNRTENNYVISGPVWEYFYSLEPKYHRSSFIEQNRGFHTDNETIHHGLMKEFTLDMANGLVGKTIIHPSHLKPVQALSVVNHEEYVDAQDILASNNGDLGVKKSQYGNKMNEIKPHTNWAKKIMIKAKIYGVFHEQRSFKDLLEVGTKEFI